MAPRGPVLVQRYRRNDPHFTYVCWAADGHALYAGATADLDDRLNSHRTRASWWSEVTHVTMTKYENRRDAFEAECNLLDELTPEHAVKGVTYNRRRVAAMPAPVPLESGPYPLPEPGAPAWARQLAKTHCPQGHPYEGDNLIRYGNRRHCRACTQARNAAKRKSA